MNNIDQAIAIVGMGLRFPGANSPDEFWQNLIDGRDCSRILSKEELLDVGIAEDKLDDPNYVFRSYDVDGIEFFDGKFFGLSPREARLADPQLRFMLETVYECMENSGHNLLGKNVGLYIGATDNKYWLYHKLFQSSLEADGEIAKRIFTLKDYFATQVSHRLGLTGPSISMNSACSTALLATHEACNHLLMYDCDYALAGGCEILKGVGYRYQEGGLSSRDGYVRAFDVGASGTAFGSGIGVVLLRRLSDALKDCDHIYAVIRSTAVNNDGNQKVGYMAPGIPGQMGVIDGALSRAGVGARDISYVEAHGTGTNVGDPIEIESLTNVYRKYTTDRQYCAIGSVKTNVGHLSIAAGIAGLIKTALMLKHKKIPASLNFSQANSAINFPQTPFYVNSKLKDWTNEPRIAGVSAFGVGGTNTHAVLQEAPDRSTQISEAKLPHLIPISAKCTNALFEAKGRLADFLDIRPTVNLVDLAYTLGSGRPHYGYRCSIVACDVEGAVRQLRTSNGVVRKLSDNPAERIAFMFPGQGSQYVNMAREFYDSEPVYLNIFNRCADVLTDFDLDIRSVLYPNRGTEDAARHKLDQTQYTQVALFVTSYALAQLLKSWGITPTAMIGHSIGEYVAACLADVFSIEEGLKLVLCRGRLMQSMPFGSMLSVPLPRERLQDFLDGEVSISGINSPTSTVVSGSTESINRLVARLTRNGVKSTVLRTSHAFHSVMMEPILERYRDVVSNIVLRAPSIPFVSNVSGTWITDSQAINPNYWVSQLREPVLFSSGLDALIGINGATLLEVGPGAVLSTLANQHDLIGKSRVVRAMRRETESASDREWLLHAIGELWGAGVGVNWTKLTGDVKGMRIPLPTYPFQRKRYWLEKEELEKPHIEVAPNRPLDHPLLGRRIISTKRVVAYENHIDRDTPKFISDHRLVETTIFPGAGFTQMALAIGRHFVQNKKIRLDEVRFAQALMLPEGVRKIVQTIATAREPYGCAFEIMSKTLGRSDKAKDSAWVLHAKGVLSAHSELPKSCTMPKLFDKEGSELIPLDLYYDALKFITFGPSFRAVRRMWIGERESLGWVKLPEHLESDVAQYSFHPVLLDAAFQVIDGPKISESGTLPVGLKRFTIYDDVPLEFYVAANRINPPDEEYSIGNITIFAQDGKIIAHIEHYLQKEIVDSLDFRDKFKGLLYEISWVNNAVAADRSLLESGRRWVLIGPQDIITDGLAMLLTEQGQIAERLHEWPLVLNDLGLTADGTQGNSEFAGVLAEKKLNGIIFARALDQSIDAEALCLEFLRLIQFICSLDLESPPPLFIVTCGAQYVSSDDLYDVSSACQATLWGLGNTVTAEHPELKCVRMDLDRTPESLAAMANDLLAPSTENQFAYRNGTRHCPRLRDYVPAENVPGKIRVPTSAFEVRLTEFGTFDGFVAREVIPDVLSDDEVHVEISHAALNFKETLYVLGFLNPNQRAAMNIDFGMEGAGKIKRIGVNVKHLQPGDNVIVWHNGCLRSDFIVNADRVIKMPVELNYAQAACVPTVFMTAYYALFDLASIQSGDRILIHACAGGVGQVALQIAKRVGAEVFATASEGKWQFLATQGVKHIMNSRALDFADQIMSVTEGRGVNVVLNSLAGDFIPKSFDALAENGRFIEIGKKEIWTHERAQAYRPDVDYQFFEIGEDVVSGGIGNKSPIRRLMVCILDDFAKGKLDPLPMTEFPLRDIGNAFRYLSAGKNVGKVVVDLQSARGGLRVESIIDDAKSYLITGGLGALGFLSANWLIKKGAKHLILTGRSEPTAHVQKKLTELRKSGIDIRSVQADVTKREDLEKVIADIGAQQAAPLCGVLHCAGVLEDGVLVQQTAKKFSRCLRPKIAGSWHLHELTQHHALDFFICFSSVSAILDGGGQGNYAAANAYMDRLMSYRRQMGLPGLSVNWGGWTDVGMAAELIERKGGHTNSLISKEEAFLALERLIVEDKSQATVCKLGERLQTTNIPPFLHDLVDTTNVDSGELNEMEYITKANPNNTTLQNLEIFVCKQVIKVLGMDSAETIDFDEEFVELGVDSLSMTELRNAVQQGLGKSMKMATFFAHSSVSRLANYLCEDRRVSASEKSQIDARATRSKRKDWSSVEFVSLSENTESDIFCFPGLNGNVFDFSDFAYDNRQKYNTRVAQLVADLGVLETDIQKIASRAIEEVQTIQSHGPYRLIGFSYGGVIAIEAARQLIDSGKNIEFLLMIDTFPHFIYGNNPNFRSYMSALIADSILSPMSLSEVEYDRLAKKIMESSIDDLTRLFSTIDKKRAKNFRVNADLLKSILIDGEKRTRAYYRPPTSIPGVDIQFIRAGLQPRSVEIADLTEFLNTPDMVDNIYGWGKYVDSQFNMNRLPAHHNSLLRGDHVAEISLIVDHLAGLHDSARDTEKSVR